MKTNLHLVETNLLVLRLKITRTVVLQSAVAVLLIWVCRCCVAVWRLQICWRSMAPLEKDGDLYDNDIITAKHFFTSYKPYRLKAIFNLSTTYACVLPMKAFFEFACSF